MHDSILRLEAYLQNDECLDSHRPNSQQTIWEFQKIRGEPSFPEPAADTAKHWTVHPSGDAPGVGNV